MKPCQMVVMKTEFLWGEKGKDTEHIHAGVCNKKDEFCHVICCLCSQLHPQTPPNLSPLTVMKTLFKILYFSSRGYYFRAAFILLTSNCAAAI